MQILYFDSFYFKQLDSILRKAQLLLLDIPKFNLSNIAHDTLTSYVPFSLRCQFLHTTFLIKNFKQDTCILHKILVDFCSHHTNKYPVLWQDWENYIKH